MSQLAHRDNVESTLSTCDNADQMLSHDKTAPCSFLLSCWDRLLIMPILRSNHMSYDRSLQIHRNGMQL